MKKNKLKVASLFAGVGGIDLGFEKAGFKIVYANEIDPYPTQTYNLNFNLIADNRDIYEVRASEIPDFNVLVGGFPCQAFSIAGYREGFEDKKGRGTLFFEIIRLIEEKKTIGKQPSIVFLENVKNLKTHDKGKTFKVIIQALQELGYTVKSAVLNACEYGNIPQNRERIYIVGFLDEKEALNFDFSKIEKLNLTTKITDLISQKKMDDSLYYTSKFKQFSELNEKIQKTDTLYQWRRQYVRENKNQLCPTLTANMGTGGHNVPLVLTKHGIRKLTPKECFLFQGFPKDFKLPKTATSRLYKQAGNSVVVPVIERIANEIKKSII